MVGIWLPWEPSSSSKVRINTPLFALSQAMSLGRFFDAHVSPVAIEQSCMSLHMFGVIQTNVDGGFVSGFMYGRLYLPRHVREIGPGNVFAHVEVAAGQRVGIRLAAGKAFARHRLGIAGERHLRRQQFAARDSRRRNVTGHLSPVTPCVEPLNSAK